ncbi:MAG: hypothetical protein OXQ90_15800 [Gammaproteobacteria bacterium]|nr:hypothetical protein [Gammaproteobacteria bacterium]
MKSLLLTLIIICGALAATAADDGSPLEAVYEDFALGGVFDPDLSNAEANELVSRGLFGDDPRLARLSLQAMAALAMGSGRGNLGFSSVVVERNFAAVPQLKEFLIARWDAKVAEEGHISLLGEPDDSLPQMRKMVADDNREGLWGTMAAALPDWLLIPRVLVAYFPGDPDVERLLWKLESHLPHGGAFLTLFNQGRFKTPEVDRMRIETVGGDDHFASLVAAKGLAFSRPEGGIDALVSALRKHPERASFLVDTLVSYGPEATPHLEKIPESDLPASVFAQVRDGLERVKRAEAATQQQH